MTDALPELRNGYIPRRWPAAGQYHGRVPAWKIWRLIDAMVIGIESEIDDKIVGIIPPNTPLPPENAGRAVGVHQKKVRALQLDPEFGEEVDRRIETRRQCLKPSVLAMAVEIIEDRSNSPKDRIRAGLCILGPKPAQGVTVNVQQNNAGAAPSGYVINLIRRTDPRQRTENHRRGNRHHATAQGWPLIKSPGERRRIAQAGAN
jgi:hypothetical protein